MNRLPSVALVPLALLGLPAIAAGPPAALESRSSMEVGVYFFQARNSLEYPSADVSTRVEQIGISWHERFGGHVQVGLHGGYSYVTQNDNPLTSGLQLDGYHAGLVLIVDLTPASSAVQLVADATFTYQQVSHESATQTTDIDWRESRLGLWSSIPLSAAFQVVAAVRYGWTDGQQRTSGVVNSTIDFDQRQAGAAAGLNLSDGQRGSIGVLGYSGLDEGWEVYFKRQF